MFEERYVELESKITQEPNEILSAAHNLGEDANAAAAHNLAAAATEKAKNTGDMPRSQNSKNEKIKEGDGEIRSSH